MINNASSATAVSSKGGEETLQVFVRVRPPIYREIKLETAVSAYGGNTVVLHNEGKDTTCTYNQVFNEFTEQEQIFEKIKPLLVDTLSGVNACIFAYGQTSSGESLATLPSTSRLLIVDLLVNRKIIHDDWTKWRTRPCSL
jgi:hypothetical protein